MMGGNIGGTPLLTTDGLVTLNFNQLNRPKLTRLPKIDMYFRGTNTSMSDSVGNLLFYSNGSKIFGFDHNLMPNGDTLSPNYKRLGENSTQGIVALPFPGQKGKYVFLNKEVKDYPAFVASARMFSGIIDMQLNNGKGRVLKKREVLMEDTLEYGRITACRHANGRDWWIIQPEFDSNRFYRFYLGVLGFVLKGNQTVGAVVEHGAGQMAFSPDGPKFIWAKGT